ncbi:putative dehydroshikimate dehydratase [Thozetella sp. PMI_491]|nr:putative dehydroshikimate dehydratase [Thozetella sp. PMI_491]
MPCRLAITSMSLGRCWAGHTLAHRLDLAQKYGYTGIELFHEDLADIADQLSRQSPTPLPQATAELAAARLIYQMCQSRGIEVLCLQPFMHYEGLLDRAEHARRIEQLHLWIELAHELHTDIIQIPCNFLPADQVTEDLGLIVSDLQEVADIGLAASPPIRYVYESLCWGTRVDTWERCWEVVQRVDRPNFGICLDSFNIAGRIYADPASLTGRTPDAEQVVRDSIARMVADIDIRKVFYVQIVDAERLAEPLVEGHQFYNAEQPTRMSWSRNCRLFYGEKERGAYLPIKDIATAFFRTLGFEGWVSLELFNRRMGDADPKVPEELAQRGAISWAKLVKDMKLNVERPVETGRISASL